MFKVQNKFTFIFISDIKKSSNIHQGTMEITNHMGDSGKKLKYN